MGRKSFENLTGIADKRRVNLHVLVDFGAVDLNVNLSSALGVSAQSPVTRSSKRIPTAISKSAS